MFVTKLSLVCAFGVIYECFILNYVMNFQGIIGDFSSIKKDIMEDTIMIAKEGISKITIRNENYLPKL